MYRTRNLPIPNGLNLPLGGAVGNRVCGPRGARRTTAAVWNQYFKWLWDNIYLLFESGFSTASVKWMPAMCTRNLPSSSSVKSCRFLFVPWLLKFNPYTCCWWTVTGQWAESKDVDHGAVKPFTWSKYSSFGPQLLCERGYMQKKT